MQLTIEHIEKSMAGGNITPRQVADFRIFLAALYSLRAAEMQSILAVKPQRWLAIREKKNSDKAADREWQTTEQGQREQELKWEMKRIEKLLSALASMLRVMENEARNIM